MKPGAAIGVGLCHAAICQFLALVLAGAGHGWVTPMVWGSAGFVLIPFCYWCASEPQPASAARIVAGLVLSLGADLVIWDRTVAEGVQYFAVMGWLSYVWIAVWLLGQAPLFRALIVRFRRTEGEPA